MLPELPITYLDVARLPGEHNSRGLLHEEGGVVLHHDIISAPSHVIATPPLSSTYSGQEPLEVVRNVRCSLLGHFVM